MEGDHAVQQNQRSISAIMATGIGVSHFDGTLLKKLQN